MDGDYDVTSIIDDGTLDPPDGLPKNWTPVFDAVVRITAGGEFGSGFLIAADRVLTCHHVIPAPEALDRAVIKRRFYQGATTETLTASKDGFWTSEELDATVFSVAPVALLRSLDLEYAGDAEVGDEVHVFGYPRGKKLRYSRDDTAVKDVGPHVIHYRADTEGGMSGGPVLRARDGVLLAMHHLGDVDGDQTNEGVRATVIRNAMEAP